MSIQINTAEGILEVGGTALIAGVSILGVAPFTAVLIITGASAVASLVSVVAYRAIIEICNIREGENSLKVLTKSVCIIASGIAAGVVVGALFAPTLSAIAGLSCFFIIAATGSAIIVAYADAVANSRHSW